MLKATSLSRRIGTAAAAVCIAALAGCGVAMAAPADAHAATAKLTGVTCTADGQNHTVKANVKGAYGEPEIYYSTSKLTKTNYKSGSTNPNSVAQDKAGTTKVYVAYVYKNSAGSSKIFKAKSTTINIKPSVKTAGTEFKDSLGTAVYKGTYDQAAHSVTVNPDKSAAADYKVYYSTKKSLNYSNYEKYGDDAVPTFTKAGNHKVYWIAVPASGEVNSKNVTKGSKTISIARKAMSSADITASADLATAMTGYGFSGIAGTDDSTAANTRYYYNAKPFSDTASGDNKLLLDVRDRGAASQTAITKGTDYTVRYTNNSKMGTATITLTGKGNYTGSKKIQFAIVSKSIDECYFKIGGVKVGKGADINLAANSTESTKAAYEYKYYTSSKLVKPTVEVYTDANYTNLVSTMNIKKTYDQGKTDGSYPYEGTKRVIGTASVKIDGWHNFTGSTTITFAVVAE